MSTEKHCPHCGKTKPASEFSIKNHKTGELLSWCRECEREASRARYVSHPKPKLTEKLCKTCGRLLPLNAFEKRSDRVDSVRSICHECRIVEKRLKKQQLSHIGGSDA